MKAGQLFRTRIIFSEKAFAEMVLGQLPKPVAGATHPYKYRLAYVVSGACVLRYDNEVGKGDHRHGGEKQNTYEFTTPRQLIIDLERDISRSNRENRNS